MSFIFDVVSARFCGSALIYDGSGFAARNAAPAAQRRRPTDDPAE